MAINPNANFNELTIWLEENLTDNKSIKACFQEVNSVPEIKGIYFWFMHSDAYKVLNIKPIEPKYTRNINGSKYDLVYLGTAGVRNNSSGVNNDHLRKRIKWHLCDNKNISSLCTQSGSTMSTLRNTIGGLISDDLIANNTQNKIDEFLCKYFFIYFVEYPGTFLEVKDEVSTDEGILINVIRPIFNLKNNPNADIPNHITCMIQQRRQKIEKDSKKRWCNEKTNNNSKIISSKPNQNLEKENKVILEIDCVTFEVKRNENISIVADSISNLPTGPCSIELFYSNRADVRIYINGRKRNIPTLKRSVSQYFNAPDTANGKIPKWKIVQNEMNEPNKIINKITVKVCRIIINRNTKPKTENKVTPILLKGEANKKIKNTLNKKTDVLNLSKNFKVVMICAGGKNDSFFTSYPDNNFVNEPNENQPNENHPDEIMNDGITWREYLNINQSDANLKKAYELYKPRKTGIYTRMYNKYLNRFFILSAGWGLVKSDFKLPNYDITFSTDKKSPKNTRRNQNINMLPIYKDFNQLNVNINDDIVYVGGVKYLKLFYKLTKDLPNRKIIYYNSKNNPKPLLGNYLYRRYFIKYPTNWHYELAEKIANGIIP